VIVLINPILSFPFPHLYLLDDSDQIIAQFFKDALELELLQLDDDEVELTGILNILLHLCRQHLQIGKNVVSHDRRQGHR